MKQGTNPKSDDQSSVLIRQGRRLVVLVVGVTLLLFGAVMLIFPGPGVATILLGLAILSAEFLWARRLFRKLKEKSDSATESIKKQIQN